MATATLEAKPLPGNLRRSLDFYQSTVGKKILMAASGGILFAFVMVHMLGNLQVYLGPEVLNAYAKFLKSSMELLWAARLILLATIATHITMMFQLWQINQKSRPQRYAVQKATTSSYASRTMYISGPILFFFIVYHLAHLTTGAAHPAFSHDDVYRNVILGFRQPVAFGAYVIAMSLLGFHLIHGVWSMFQTLGVAHPKYTPMLRNFATAATSLIVFGNVSMPVAIITGLIGGDVR
jgi:succinate dehydrogenase / fumarate reductase cytochrome b subunit